MPFDRVTPIFAQGLSPTQRIDAYNSIAKYYDQEYSEAGYSAPKKVAEMVDGRFGDRKDSVSILDMACGTGLVGIELSKIGFQNIDGFDPAENMLEIARKRNVYRSVRCIGISEKLDLDNETYDAVIVCGIHTNADTISNGFPELLRVLKTGGYVVFTVRKYIFHGGRYHPFALNLKKLEEEGKITIVEDTYPNIIKNVEGVILWLQKN